MVRIIGLDNDGNVLYDNKTIRDYWVTETKYHFDECMYMMLFGDVSKILIEKENNDASSENQ